MPTPSRSARGLHGLSVPRSLKQPLPPLSPQNFAMLYFAGDPRKKICPQRAIHKVARKSVGSRSATGSHGLSTPSKLKRPVPPLSPQNFAMLYFAGAPRKENMPPKSNTQSRSQERGLTERGDKREKECSRGHFFLCIPNICCTFVRQIKKIGKWQMNIISPQC